MCRLSPAPTSAMYELRPSSAAPHASKSKGVSSHGKNSWARCSLSICDSANSGAKSSSGAPIS